MQANQNLNTVEGNTFSTSGTNMQTSPTTFISQPEYTTTTTYIQQPSPSFTQQNLSQQPLPQQSSFSQQPLGQQSSFSQQPLGQQSFSQQPLSQQSGFSQQPFDQQSISQQPLSQQSSLSQQPFDQQSFSQQPLGQQSFSQQPLSQQTSFSQQPLGQQSFSQQGFPQQQLPAQFANGQPYTIRTTQPLSSFSTMPSTYSNPSSFNNVAAGPGTYVGTNTMIPAMSAGAPFQQYGGNQQLGNTNVGDLELTKRMLDVNRETQLKYADMEADKQKKLEDKAEKHRVKAAKWKARHLEAMVHRHENKSFKLEQKAHIHYMKAEDYKAAAKQIERERKQYDPPSDKKDEKKPATGDKTKTKTEEKKSDSTDKKPEVDVKKSTDTTKNADGSTTKTETKEKTTDSGNNAQQQQQQQLQSYNSPMQQQNYNSPMQQQQQSYNSVPQDQYGSPVQRGSGNQLHNSWGPMSGGPIAVPQQPTTIYSSFNSPQTTGYYDPDRPKRAPILEKRDPNARYQQDVSTAAIRNTKYNTTGDQSVQQQVSATGLGRQ